MKSKIMAGVGLVSIILLALAARPRMMAWRYNNATVAQVGDYKITARDIAWKNAVVRIYSPAETRDVGLQLLIGTYTTAQILKNNGQEITDEILKKESERIDKDTLRPEVLATIKGVFDGDEKGYQRVYIMDIYGARTIYYDFFMHSTPIHAASKQLAEDFMKRVHADPNQFYDEAKKSELKPLPLTVSLNSGLVWESKEDKKEQSGPKIIDASKTPADMQMKFNANAAALEVSEEGQRWIKDIVGTTAPNHVFQQVIDQNEQWMIARYLGQHKSQKDTYLFEVVMFPKADFAKWSAEQTSLVKVSPRQ
jgi:hypothetical protein